MSTSPPVRGVALPEGQSGSSFLHEVLASAVAAFPAELGGAGFPSDPRRFKDTFGDALVRFEAARAASPRRVEMAVHMRRLTASRVRFVDDRGSRSLMEVMAAPAAPAALRTWTTRGSGRLQPGITAGGVHRTGNELRSWLAGALERRLFTEVVHERLTRLLARAEAEGGLSLAGERFVLLGAGAELSPARLLLAAGAEVLWVDLRPPPDRLIASEGLGGVLHAAEAGMNLLADPMGVLATVRRFAEAGPVHVGMYAYMGGESQEWRLTAAMNTILRSLRADEVASMSLLISPTTVSVASAEDVAVAERRLRDAAAWKRALARAGVLRRGGEPCGDGRVGYTIVPLQGASYQAAQYVGKVLAAESHAVLGPSLEGGPLTVSANTAPITNTKSLAHPVFQAGFLAAPAWGITIAEPAMTVDLNGLLMMADVTDAEAPAAAGRAWATQAERARAVFRESVHGGLFAQPYAAYGAIQVAAVMGFAQRPSLLAQLARGR
jgi:hypothetical protein